MTDPDREVEHLLYRALVRLRDDGTPRTRHLTTNAIIARPVARRTRPFQATEALPLHAIITGRYRDTFHRSGGTWCFASRTMVSDLTGDLSRHLPG